jgi:predicted enzyme related to lactoylglutathione lyase
MNKEKEKNEYSQNSLHAVVIKVQNLNICRAFYRELLELGAPVMDSNFWVEFKIGASASLVLEQIVTGEIVPEGRGRISWLCMVEDLEKMIKKLKENGYDPISEEIDLLGMKTLQFCDPEGNQFVLCERKKEKE